MSLLSVAFLSLVVVLKLTLSLILVRRIQNVRLALGIVTFEASVKDFFLRKE